MSAYKSCPAKWYVFTKIFDLISNYWLRELITSIVYLLALRFLEKENNVDLKMKIVNPRYEKFKKTSKS